MLAALNPFGPARPCEEASCLPEITTQLVIIFCGKIFLAKLVDVGRPFAQQAVGIHLAKMTHTLNIKQLDQVRALMLLEDSDEIAKDRRDEEERIQRMEHHEDAGLEITDPVELQARKPAP